MYVRPPCRSWLLGNYTYTIAGPNVTLTVDRLDNLGQQESGELQMELWALPQPYTGLGQTGYDQTGFRMAVYPLGRIAPSYYLAFVNSGPIPFTQPPPGTWFFVTIITQYDASNINGQGWLPSQFHNFAGAVVVNPSPVGTPVGGLWFDPTQPGTGYTIEVKNGSAIVVTFAYQPTGLPQWYISTGPMVGQTFVATLDKYVGGPCIPCNDTRFSTPTGNDGTIIINFTSATTATALLPGGRVANIVPAVQ